MAFSATQKVAIYRYLGFPLHTTNTSLEVAIDAVGDAGPKQAAVETILAELLTVDATLASSGSSTTTAGALKKVDDIEFHPPATTTSESEVDAWTRAKMLIERLRQIFGIGLDGEFFGTEPIGGVSSGARVRSNCMRGW